MSHASEFYYTWVIINNIIYITIKIGEVYKYIDLIVQPLRSLKHFPFPSYINYRYSRLHRDTSRDTFVQVVSASCALTQTHKSRVREEDSLPHSMRFLSLEA